MHAKEITLSAIALNEVQTFSPCKTRPRSRPSDGWRVYAVVVYDECIKKDERSENFHYERTRRARAYPSLPTYAA